jgi:D-glucuronyl C5-epimerase C-terminus
MFAPWASAFSQAAIIERLLLLHCVKKDPYYLDMARRAARAFAISVLDGGLRSENPDFTWFQEVPLPDRHNPHILNAHLYAIYVLNLLHPYFPDEGFDRLASRGLQAVTKVIAVIDSGHWNRYDLRPSYPAFFLSIAKTDAVLKGLAVRIGEQQSDIHFGNGESIPWGSDAQAKHASPRAQQAVTIQNDLSINIILPEGREFHWTLSQRPMTLIAHIACCGSPLEISTLGQRPGPIEMVRLPLKSRLRAGDDEILTFDTGIHDASWGQVASEYIPYHAALMAHLYRQTGRKDLYLHALRWQGFFRRYAERTPAEKASAAVPILNKFSFQPDEELVAKLPERLQGRMPEEVSEAEIAEAIEAIYPQQPDETCHHDQISSACRRRQARETLALSRDFD